MAESSDLGAVFRLLAEAFDDTGIDILALSLFPPVRAEFTTGMNRSQKIQMVVDYASRNGRIPDLLHYIQHENPHQYQHFVQQHPTASPQALQTLFNQAVTLFRQRVLLENQVGIQSAFTEMQTRYEALQTAVHPVPLEATSQYQTAQQLLSILAGNNEMDVLIQQLVQNQASWLEEIAAAYLLAHRLLAARNRRLFRKARLHLPKGKLLENRRLALERIDRDENYVQRRVWPIPKREDPPPGYHSPYIDTVLRRRNPFLHQRAEEDKALLFRQNRPLFWPSALYPTLFNVNTPLIISGALGSGRTTLALALGRYHTRNTRLSLYLSGEPDPQEIHREFVQRLFEFVLHHPTLLVRLRAEEYDVLAKVLVGALDRDIITAEIANIIVNLPRSRWLTQAKLDDRPYWVHLAQEQLQQLKEDVQQVRLEQHSGNWAESLSFAAHSLDFEQVVLVLDVNSTGPAWLETAVLPNLSRWYANERGFITLLFIPNTLTSQLSLRNTRPQQITWSKEDLLNMVWHRYQRIFGDRASLEELFDDETLEQLLEAAQVESAYNPGRFMALWRGLTAEKASGKITSEELTAILTREQSSSTTLPTIINRIQLHNQISSSFNLEELTQLCFDLSIDFQNLKGGTKSEKVTELILYVERYQRLPALLTRLAELRPDIFAPPL